MNGPHPTTTTTKPDPHQRGARSARTLRASRMIEHRRPPMTRASTEQAAPPAPLLRFDDEPMFVGGHLSAQLVQRQWRCW